MRLLVILCLVCLIQPTLQIIFGRSSPRFPPWLSPMYPGSYPYGRYPYGSYPYGSHPYWYKWFRKGGIGGLALCPPPIPNLIGCGQPACLASTCSIPGATCIECPICIAVWQLNGVRVPC